MKKSLALVERETTWQALAVVVLVLLSAVLEAFSIGLIFAFVQVFIDPSRIENLPWLIDLLGPALAENESGILIFLTLSLLGLFVIKNLTLLGFYYVKARFVAVNEALMAERLLKGYLDGAYILHLSRNSAEFIRNITGAVSAVFSTVVMGFIDLAAEFIVIVALGTVLLLVEPVLTLGAALVLGTAILVFFTFTKRRFISWGMQEQEITGTILKSLQQGLHSIKEVKVFGRQNFILESFKTPRRELVGVDVKIGTMSHTPRLWGETVVVAVVLLTVVYALSKGDQSAEILSTLTIFAAAAFRMIPSMNRILGALNSVKNGTHAVNLVYNDIKEFQGNLDEHVEDDGRKLPFTDSLSVEGVSFRYDENTGLVLDDINLVLEKGSSLGLVGPSGSGKTTFVDIVLGLLAPTSGQITVDGVDIFTAIRAWRRQIGYVPQSIYVTDDSLRRNVAFGLSDDEIDKAKLEKAISLAQLDELVESLSDGLDTPLGEQGSRLSGGQRQRVGIARALYRDPEVLILDEATSSLDAETEHEINNAIEHLTGRKTLIIIAHRLSTVRKCQSLAFVKDGRLMDTGSFDDLNTRNEDFHRLVDLSQL